MNHSYFYINKYDYFTRNYKKFYSLSLVLQDNNWDNNYLFILLNKINQSYLLKNALIK